MTGKLPTASLVLALLSLPAVAQDEGATAEFGNYRFVSGETVVIEQTGTDNLLAAGAAVKIEGGHTGSAYIAGRTVEIRGPIGGDAFIAGMDVVVDAPVSGDASIKGSNVTVGEIGGNLRASAGTLNVNGPVAGYAVLSGDDVLLEDIVSGDLYINARNVGFGDSARVEGRLVVFEDEVGKMEIPGDIASDARIERRNVSEWEDAVSSLTSETWQSLVRSFLIGVLVIAVLASLIAAVIPQSLAELRRSLLDRPLRNVWFGFLAESVAMGAAIAMAATLVVVFAATLTGLLLIPASLVFMLVVGFAGYVVAAYSLGAGLLMLIGRPEPGGIGARITAAGTGALVAGAIAFLPFVGWPFALVLVLAGVGAITLKLFQPAFYVSARSVSTG